MATLGQLEKASRSSRRKSRSSLSCSRAARQALTTSGASRSSSARIALALNRNMPLFQVKRPLARNCSAVARSGFSTNRAIGTGVLAVVGLAMVNGCAASM